VGETGRFQESLRELPIYLVQQGMIDCMGFECREAGLVFGRKPCKLLTLLCLLVQHLPILLTYWKRRQIHRLPGQRLGRSRSAGDRESFRTPCADVLHHPSCFLIT